MPRLRLLSAALACAALTLPAAASADGWTTGFPVSGAGASEPSLAADGSGAVTAIWLRGGVVEVANRGAGGSFPAPQALSGAGSSVPSLAVNASGRAVAVWVRDGSVRAALRPGAGQPFGPGQEVSSPGSPQRPVAGIDAAGNVTIGWIRGNVVELVRRAAGAGAWGGPQQIAEAEPQRLALAVGPGGAATALWTVQASGAFDLRAATRTPAATTFAAPTTLEAVIEDVVGDRPVPKVAVDGSDAFTAVWANHQLTTSPRAPVLRTARRTASGAFGPVSSVTGIVNDRAANPHPDVAVNAAGDALVAWNRMFDDAVTVEAARRPGPGAFDPALPAGGPGVAEHSDPSVALDAQGRGVAVWLQSGVIRASRLTGAFAPSAPLSGAGAAWHPKVAFDASGNAVAVWARDGRIETAAYDVVPPEVVSVSAPESGATGAELRLAGSGRDGQSAVSVSWSFGDGATASGTEVAHRYAAPGTYDVTMVVTDGGGNAVSSAKRKVTISGGAGGGGAERPGGEEGAPETPRVEQPGPPVQEAPRGEDRPDVPALGARLSALRLRPAKLRSGRGGRVTFALSAPARVVLTLERAVKVSGRTVWRRVAGSLGVDGRAGANGVGLPARPGGRKLAAGRYRLVATVGAAAPVRRGFRVVRAR